MFYNRFGFRLIVQLLFINGLGCILFYLIKNTQLWFTIGGLSLLLLGSIFWLQQYINQIRLDIKRFVLAVKTRDHTLNFQNKASKSSFPELYHSFGEILQVHKEIRLEQDAMFQLISNILAQVPVGVIVVKNSFDEKENQEIAFFNQAASALLAIPTFKYWHRLKQHIPYFALEIEKLAFGGKQFLELKIQDRAIQLSTEVIPLQLYGNKYSIISFQNIKDEIEQKETEAWNRLIGVISHEILNSITPISSLSDTINHMVSEKNSLNATEMEDLKMALQTIKRRSSGLLDFVKDYRLIAELPTPVLVPHTIAEILKHIKVLMMPFTQIKNIDLVVAETSAKITLKLDLKLIEQALINLITNSIYALEEQEEPKIWINYRLENAKLYIDVSDNGKGIEDAHIDKIFVPFYTTRKGGSGIGLTITRNIMKMHHGNVEATSIPNKETTFSLVFNYK